MAYTVKITYSGIPAELPDSSASICSIFIPNGSYIDSAVYTEGYEVGAEAESKKYGRSVYATNVDGWGNTEVKEPFASTSIPFPVALAQFMLAVVGEDNEVTLDVDDYKEAFYYKELGQSLADQGFTVEVSPKA